MDNDLWTGQERRNVVLLALVLNLIFAAFLYMAHPIAGTIWAFIGGFATGGIANSSIRELSSLAEE